MPDWLRRTRATKASSSNSASSGSRAMCAISGARRPRPSETASPPNIRWSTNRSSRSGWPSSTNRTRRLRSSGTPGGCTSIWPLMPRWPRRASPLSRESQRYFPRRWAAVKVRPVRRAAKSAGPAGGGVRGAGAGRRRRRSGGPGRGPRGRCGRPRPREAQASPAGDARRGPAEAPRRVAGGQLGAQGPVGGLGRLLLGLLLRPADAAPVQPLGDADPGGEGLHVVGALVLDDVLGHAEVVQGAELLEAGLPVESRAHGRGGLQHRVEEQVDDAGGLVEAGAEVDGADQGLDGVGEDRGLLAATGRLLALAELDVPPSPMVRATSASARALTTAARSLARRPSERSGWVT